MNQVAYWDLRAEIEAKIKAAGGWVNAHAHIDRAYTVTQENLGLYSAQRTEKWALNDDLRIRSTVDQIYDRMAKAIERMLEQGVAAIATFIDVDCNTKDKAIQAAIRIREKYGSDIIIKYLNQSSYGLFDEAKESRYWFDLGAEFVDIIGGLLKADAGREEEHLDILLSTAKRHGKMAQIHIDELNLPEERETELLARKMIEYGMQGRVSGIHGISINARSMEERQNIYRLMAEAQLMMVSCPLAWLDARRSEQLAPIHNPITPLDEMLPHNLVVALGTDNIADIWKPFNDGDMWADLRVLLEATRTFDIDTLVNIATVNGRKVLGI